MFWKTLTDSTEGRSSDNGARSPFVGQLNVVILLFSLEVVGDGRCEKQNRNYNLEIMCDRMILNNKAKKIFEYILFTHK